MLLLKPIPTGTTYQYPKIIERTDGLFASLSGLPMLTKIFDVSSYDVPYPNGLAELPPICIATIATRVATFIGREAYAPYTTFGHI